MAEPPEKRMGSLAGRWHLVAAECPENQIPRHRVDLVFMTNLPDFGEPFSRGGATAVKFNFKRSRFVVRNCA